MTARQAGKPASPAGGDALSPAAVLWLWRIGRSVQAELVWPLPIYTLLFILSQITLLLALLLPWNILATLSLGHSPARFEEIFGQLGSGPVVGILMALVLICFGAHLAAEAAGASMCQRASAVIIDRHRKLGLSDSLRGSAASDYRRILRLFAMIAYSIIAAILIAVSYPALLVILVAYVTLGAMVAAIMPPAAPQSVASELRSKAWWGIGFICLVGWVVRDAWHGTMPSFWSVFFALLLARQALIFLMMSVSSLGVLLRRRDRVEALFVADRLVTMPPRPQAGLTALLAEDRREGWLNPLFSELGAEDLSLDPGATHWAERGKVAYLVARSEKPGSGPGLMIRLFQQSVAGLGHHEAELLKHGTQDWPVPAFLGAREIDGNLALVFRWPEECDWAPSVEDRKETLALRSRVLGCEIPYDLAARYLRSRARLPERAGVVDWPVLAGIAKTGDQATACAAIASAWPLVMDWLCQRPSQIVLPKITARRMAGQPAADGDRRRLICNWTLWQWEPLGFDWPWRERPERDLRHCLDLATQTRPSLADCRLEDALLVAVVASFTDRSEAGDFGAMLDMLLPLRNAVERCGLLRGPQGEYPKDAAENEPGSPSAQAGGGDAVVSASVSRCGHSLDAHHGCPWSRAGPIAR